MQKELKKINEKAKSIFNGQLVYTKDKKQAQQFSIILCEDALKNGGNPEFWNAVKHNLETLKFDDKNRR